MTFRRAKDPFRVAFSEALPLLWTDGRKLRQILTNLINASSSPTKEALLSRLRKRSRRMTVAMCDPKSAAKYLSTSPHRPKSRGVPPPMWGFHTPAIKTLLPDLVARVGQQKISLLKKINLNQPTILVSH